MRSKCQISLNFNYKVYFKDFYTKRCVFSQIKDMKHIKRIFHSAAWVMPHWWDLGCWRGGGVKQLERGDLRWLRSSLSFNFNILLINNEHPDQTPHFSLSTILPMSNKKHDKLIGLYGLMADMLIAQTFFSRQSRRLFTNHVTPCADLEGDRGPDPPPPPHTHSEKSQKI